MKTGAKTQYPVERRGFSSESFLQRQSPKLQAASANAAAKRAAERDLAKQQAASARESYDKQVEAQRKKYMDMAAQVDAPGTENMYDGHFRMLDELAQHLADPENIKRFASTPEGEMEFTSLLDQLDTMTGTFESYYKSTYGTPEDEKDGNTFQASLNRSITGVDGDIDFMTPHEEMISRANALDEVSGPMFERMEIVGGRPVFYSPDGTEINFDQKFLDPNVFRSEQQLRPPVRGADLLGRSYDPMAFETEEDVEDFMLESLNRQDIMNDALRSYITDMKETNPDFDATIEDVNTNGTLRLRVQKAYVEDAINEWNKRRGAEGTESAPVSETDPADSVSGDMGEFTDADFDLDNPEDQFGDSAGVAVGTSAFAFDVRTPAVDIGGIDRKMERMTFDTDSLSWKIKMDFAEKEDGKSYPEFTLTIPTDADGKPKITKSLRNIQDAFDDEYGTAQFEKLMTEIKDRAIGSWWDQSNE